MKDMRKRLADIAKKRSQFGLTVSTGTGFDKAGVIKERETSSDINEETIVGREKEKNDLLKMLIQSDGGDDVSIIAIIGLGGVGKSTLAQLLYNDKDVSGSFNQRGWAYVSMEFDLKRIGGALLESFQGNSHIPSTLEAIRASLKEKISGKKYCIVLDDVWEEDGAKLEELRGMLRGGIKGSKIIVTTRSEKVAMQICAAHSYKLEGLSNDHCWNLFSQRAFTCESEKNDEGLEMIGKEIVRKCGGLPLAAKALGYTMRSKKGIDAWRGVKDSDIWKLAEQNRNSSQASILPSLKLSYHFMPSYLKTCFVYCAIFPKGFRILQDELIQQWIVLGFIRPHKGLSLENQGEEYVNDLLDMSFLQLNTTETKLVMHDLVHDLARSIMVDELLILDAEKSNNNLNGSNNYRYALLLNFEDLTEVCQTLPNKLRVIHCHNNSWKIMKFSNHAFSHAKYIRVLHLCCKSSPEFLTSILELKQLRYLCAPYVEVLPESFGNVLLNLIYLDLSNGMFTKLPKSCENLNLHVLKLNYCKKLEVLPETRYLKELFLEECVQLTKPPEYTFNRTCLVKSCYNHYGQPFVYKLQGCVAVKKTSSSHYDIVQINKLGALETRKDNIEITLLPNVHNLAHASKASLCTKSKLKRKSTELQQECSSSKTRSWEEIAPDEAILETIIPPKSLESLDVPGNSELVFACKWMKNIGNFPNLSSVSIRDIKNCDHLPPLGILPNLHTLSIISMRNVRKIDEALFGGSKRAFMKLETLILVDLEYIEEWPTKLPGNEGEFMFTNLNLLKVQNCPKLRFVPSFPGSRKVIVGLRSENALSCGLSQRDTSLTLTSILDFYETKLEFGALPDIIRRMTSVETLNLESINDLAKIPYWFEELVSLKELFISNCPNLEYFPWSYLPNSSVESIYINNGTHLLVESINEELLDPSVTKSEMLSNTCGSDYRVIYKKHKGISGTVGKTREVTKESSSSSSSSSSSWWNDVPMSMSDYFC